MELTMDALLRYLSAEASHHTKHLKSHLAVNPPNSITTSDYTTPNTTTL